MENQVTVFFYDNKDKIIEYWAVALNKEYPDFYNVDKLQEHGMFYLELILDIQTPIYLHPDFHKIEYWCKILADRDVPIVHTVHSTQLFKESLLQVISLYDVNHVVSANFLAMMCTRIDSLERTIVNYYWEYARKIIEEKDRKLDELHEDKINLIGKMAASMAHEIRNPLTSIKGFLKLIRRQLPQESLQTVAKYIDIVETEFENIQMQITGFLSFSKKRVMEEPFIDVLLENLIDSVLMLVTPRLINENIDVIMDYQKDSLLHIQKVPMQQVLSNLIINAIDAMYDQHENKILKIHSREDENHIYIMITNNGPEIPVEMREQLFVPFVTSKSDGTGLGLAICKQIMEKNNGNIDFITTKDHTTFVLNLKKKKQERASL